MSIQWEHDLAERPFCEQLQTMGWEWLEGDTEGDKAIRAALDMAERTRQEIGKVGFWINAYTREVLTKALVRDLDDFGLRLGAPILGPLPTAPRAA